MFWLMLWCHRTTHFTAKSLEAVGALVRGMEDAINTAAFVGVTRGGGPGELCFML